ncbi:hypothetical protein P12x_002259 [Tundrisphaera lichenicola]|uniref:hypothetical protein n=1 Tax=Tundrisphaera lichenicola TaxID=2029860 RepID=UPI003EB77837
MIKPGRWSIAVLMAVVFFVAADFAILRALCNTAEPMVIALSTLPMSNLLILTMPRIKRDSINREFWMGFQAIGWIMILLFALVTSLYYSQFLYPIGWIDDHDGLPSTSSAEIALLICCIVVIYTIPLVLGAMFGGWFSSRYRIVIERRPASSGEES